MEKYKKVKLPYGKSFLEVSIPAQNISGILSAKYTPGVKDERQAVLDSLRNPLGCRPLRESVSPGDKVVIITTDNTRPCPDDRILPVILAELDAIVPRRNITVVVALGLHPPLDKHALVKKLGRDVVENYDVLNHDPAMVTYLGTTSRGTPLEVNSRVVEADFRISTGFIEPHFFAGFSGGSKSIMPGVSSARTIRSNHSYRMLENPRAGAGILKGNPVHEDIVECGKMARLDFIVNVLLNKDGDITGVVSGDPVLAHETGCRLEREATRVTVAQPVDITITTNGGAPLDLDFYQTCKGIDTASRITRDGGIIIVASACDTGVGPQEFLASHSSSASPGEVLQKISCSETSGVCWQNQILARAQLNHEIFLYSCLEDAVARQMKVIPIHSLQEGLDAAFKALGPGAKIAVIPEGPLVLPVVKNKKG